MRKGPEMRRYVATNLRSFILTALVLAGCSQGTTSTTMAVRPSPSPGAPSPSASSAEPRLPFVSGAPVPLEAGTYLSPEGFAPVMSIALPTGWYGGGSAREFSAGQGIDEVEQRFAGGGLYVSPIDMAYDEAVAAFSNLDGLTADHEPTTQSMGGHDSTTFYVHAEGGRVVLDPIAPGLDVNAGTAHVIFIDAGGTTILIRTELFREAGAGPLDDVIASIRFP